MEHRKLQGNRLRAAGYDEGEQILEIEFTSGDVRCFLGVPRTVWRSLLAAPNPASFFEDRIEEEYATQPGERRTRSDARQQLDDLFGGR